MTIYIIYLATLEWNFFFGTILTETQIGLSETFDKMDSVFLVY